ncbi:MAG: tetratricopeptide repeat protein [Phycisphaerae bacterium]|nr:tetratricopeptide repeat protein [Phycisphaerae bacterium]
MMKIQFTILLLVTLAVSGCGYYTRTSDLNEYQTVITDPARDTEFARCCNAAGVLLLKDDNFTEAEKEFKRALSADVFFGPAHNNLGNVYYRQKQYYLAAWEFQYAVKLMPGQVEPLNNLGLVFEKVGRLNDAEEWYDKALSLKPESTEVIGNLARIRIRSNRKDKTTQELLSKIVMKDSRPEWISWAKEQIAFTRETSSDNFMPKSDEIKTLSDEFK